MKIASMATQIVSLHLSVDMGRGVLTAVDPLLVRVTTDKGHQGTGLTFALRQGEAADILARVRSLALAVVGKELEPADAVWDTMRAGLPGSGGLEAAALCGVDTALWDLRGHIAGKASPSFAGRDPRPDSRTSSM